MGGSPCLHIHLLRLFIPGNPLFATIDQANYTDQPKGETMPENKIVEDLPRGGKWPSNPIVTKVIKIVILLVALPSHPGTRS